MADIVFPTLSRKSLSFKDGSAEDAEMGIVSDLLVIIVMSDTIVIKTNPLPSWQVSVSSP